MAITQVNEGSYTTTITYSAGETIAAIRAFVVNWIVGHGGELVSQSLTTSDVFRFLQYGGTAGTSTHYDYIEIDWATTDKMIVRQWLSWSGSAGSTKAQNTYNTATGATVVTTEAALAQPVSSSLGGSIILNCSPRGFYMIGNIPGQLGNVCNNSGVCIPERRRIHTGDVAGGSSGRVFFYTGQVFINTGNNESLYRWSTPKGIDGGGNTTTSAGLRAGFACEKTWEFFAYYHINMSGPSVSTSINAVDGYNGQVQAGAVYPLIGGGASALGTGVTRLGPLCGIARKHGVAVGDIIRCNADTLGIPAETGALTEYIVVAGGLGLLR